MIQLSQTCRTPNPISGETYYIQNAHLSAKIFNKSFQWFFGEPTLTTKKSHQTPFHPCWVRLNSTTSQKKNWFVFRKSLDSGKFPIPTNHHLQVDETNQPWRFVWNGRICSKVLELMPLEGNLQVVQGGIPYLPTEEMMVPPRNGDERHGIDLPHMVA